MDEAAVIAATRRWIADMVIGLNLCPFARRVFEGDRIRYAVSAAADEHSVMEALRSELQALAAAPIEHVETTLLILPQAFPDFLDFNDVLDAAEAVVTQLGLDGVIQLASFHPQYQFADTEADDVENYTNRSPYPMLHLLREESIDAVASDPDELLEIPKRNVETLKALGREAIVKRLSSR